MTAVCAADRRWNPDPATLVCICECSHRVAAFMYMYNSYCIVDMHCLCTNECLVFYSLLLEVLWLTFHMHVSACSKYACIRGSEVFYRKFVAPFWPSPYDGIKNKFYVKVFLAGRNLVGTDCMWLYCQFMCEGILCWLLYINYRYFVLIVYGYRLTVGAMYTLHQLTVALCSWLWSTSCPTTWISRELHWHNRGFRGVL